MEVSDEASSLKKPKRLTSVVWNHFERIRNSDLCYAICVHCNKKLSGSSNSGTTHLRNHLMRCLQRSNYDVSQILPAKRIIKKDSAFALPSIIAYDDEQRKEDCLRQPPFKYDHEVKRGGISPSGTPKFDQERSRLDLARMIILHGYPLAMVDHVGFKVFVKNLQPLFDFASDSAVELYCMEMYGRGKETVREALHNMQGRINIAVEMWSSEEHAGYLSLMARYIDEDWKLQKKMLNFPTLDSSYSGDTLSEIVVNCVTEWNIDCRLFAVTLDYCSMDDDVVMKVRERLSESRHPLGSHQLLDVWSAAHILDFIVQDAVDAFRVVIQKIRRSIKYIKSSKMVLEKMNEFALQMGIENSSCLVMDCPVRWSSTYQMIQSALEYRGAFSLLKEQDPSYTSDLGDTEWDWTSTICGYVKVICEVSRVLCSYESPTANVYFPEMCHVHIQLIEWCKVPDEFVSAVALKMKERFDRYWRKCGLLLAMAVILDPRFKMKLVEYYYSQIYGSTAPDRIKEVHDGIRELFSSYSMYSLVDQGSALHDNDVTNTSNASRDRLMGFDKFLHETSQGENASSDLEKYLEEPIFPRSSDFNILNWWKVHTPRYPLLAMMARDVLGIPMSNTAPETDCRGRILDSSHSSLDPDIRQALICTRDWLQTESEGLKPLASHSSIVLCIDDRAKLICHTE
ncbi:hypothetical protein MLD38_035136 [Melastoma candidum]|uniref:Uncharacterized protein n=1 Tax=Melastoma candidum TaxID=119954 RepID=A0ACB9MBT4_9MYRT|nr:hypothetical protein MLD38_035136 [Melastoma candidum]